MWAYDIYAQLAAAGWDGHTALLLSRWYAGATFCPACHREWDSTRIPPPRVPLDIRCACCCQ